MRIFLLDYAHLRDVFSIKHDEHCYYEKSETTIMKQNWHKMNTLLDLSKHLDNEIIDEIIYRGRITVLFYKPFIQMIVELLREGGKLQVKFHMGTKKHEDVGKLYYAPPVANYDQEDYNLSIVPFPQNIGYIKERLSEFFDFKGGDMLTLTLRNKKKFDIPISSFNFQPLNSIPSNTPLSSLNDDDIYLSLNKYHVYLKQSRKRRLRGSILPFDDDNDFLFKNRVAIIGGSENSGLCRAFPGCFFPIGLQAVSSNYNGLNMSFSSWRRLENTILKEAFDVVIIERAETELTLKEDVWRLSSLLVKSGSSIFATIYHTSMVVPPYDHQKIVKKLDSMRLNSSLYIRAYIPIEVYSDIIDGNLDNFEYDYGPGSFQETTTFRYIRK
jgi:hypothetical protein